MEPSLFQEVANLATEQRNLKSWNIDELSTTEALRLINAEDALVAEAVGKEIPFIAPVVDELVERLRHHGRLIYVGAGTSGRMGVIDAAECPPTYGTAPHMIQALIAGGKEAVFSAQEGAEDKRHAGEHDLAALEVSKKDVVIGIAASKRTPYVLGALEHAKSVGAFSVLVTTNPRESLEHTFLDAAICPVVGPEVIMGSTRMKSAVAQKMVLTMITTTAMVRLGKIYENMMVDLQLTNKKLEERAKRILMIATGCSYERADELLILCHRHVKTAIIVEKMSISPLEAESLVREAGGFVKAALRLAHSRK